MSGHTPGPWRLGSPDVRCVLKHQEDGLGHGGRQCSYEFQGWFNDYSAISSEATRETVVAFDSEPSEADARLIAAAPDLLEGLRHAARRNHEPSSGCTACVKAEEAIAKAEGK